MKIQESLREANPFIWAYEVLHRCRWCESPRVSYCNTPWRDQGKWSVFHQRQMWWNLPLLMPLLHSGYYSVLITRMSEPCWYWVRTGSVFP